MAITLNQGQQYVCDSVVDWYNNSSGTLVNIIGPAGTGKSVVLNAILEKLKLKAHEVLCMAYTGQAAIVMRTKGMPTACTCHAGLFEAVREIVTDANGKPVMDKQFNVPVMKWVFYPKNLKSLGIKLIIIDEAWTVPRRFRGYIDATGIKVIAAGDNGQLPPVKDDPAYLVDGPTYQLTELMRQSESSPLIYLANRARAGFPIDYGLYGNSVLVISKEELDNTIIQNSGIVLCGRNSTREEMNIRVREEILHQYHDFPAVGERLICRKNNWEKTIDGISLCNGLIGSVLSPPNIGVFDGETFKLDFLPDLLSIPFTGLDINYEYINARSVQDREAIKASRWTDGELFEYAYASTVHLSQGSEYDNGIYIEEPIGGGIQNNLNYTAITRFRRKMIYVKTTPKYWRM